MDCFFSDAFKISVLLNPFAVLSTFIALAGKRRMEEKRMIVLKTCSFAMLAGTVVLFCGEMLFSLLDINLDLFKVGGGIVLMVCAISLVWGKEKQIQSQDSASFQSISAVPLAIPMAVGPGTAAGLIIIGTERGAGLLQCTFNVLALFIGVLVLGGVLFMGVLSEKLLSKTTISIITRLTGLFLSAIAAKMILEGIRSFLHG